MADDDLNLRYVHFQEHSKQGNHQICKHCNDSTRFVDNYISTTKYTVLSFLPVNLWLQFNKKANLYFLLVAIISLFPSLSPKPWWVSVLPLVFVLAVSAIKEAIEDFNRYRMDREVNESLVLCWRKVGDKEGFVDTQWQDVAVGDIIKVEQDDAFPADMVLLQSSLGQGVCNIETANLDGETNLKQKKARPATYNIECAADGEDYPTKFQCVLESDAPCENMDSAGWKGNFYQLPGHADAVPLSMDQLLLRGCTLRNTKWVIALVIFTGRETKLMLNNKATVYKRSMVERTVDTALYVIFALEAALCILGAALNVNWLSNNSSKQWYVPFGEINLGNEFGLSLLTYMVLLDLMVPISLYVSMELVKVAQVVLINNDLEMYHAETDTPAKARTSSLNEELGQVDFIFSDKTGTLTRNMMEFLRCTIGTHTFGPGCQEAAGMAHLQRQMSQAIPEFEKTKFRFEDNRLLHFIRSGHPDAKLFDEYLTLLATCHDVIAEYPGCEFEKCDPAKLPRGPHVHGRDQCTVCVQYQAASPDEKALVEAARDLEYYFQYRVASSNVEVAGKRIDDAQLVQVNIMGRTWTFEILASLEFTSSRKRASVVLRDPRDGKIKIYSKGADSIMFPLLSQSSKDKYWNYTAGELSKFSTIGLRTLLVAYKELTEQEFVAWYRELQTARSDMMNRAGMVANAEAAIERDLNMIGSTAIEDRLQDGVPDCIYNLGRAGIKIWVLTGDKVETAINIGRSCKLIGDHMQPANDTLLVIDIDDKLSDEAARAETEKGLAHAWSVVQNHPLGCDTQGLVISGRALGFVFPIRKLDARGREIIPGPEVLAKEEELADQLYKIATRCKAVICCRVSPKQKSQVVLLVKERVETVTLAIGDGANDVPMIKAAHVGIGISGQEGLQAVMASDYAIGQFRFLENLLLIHGARSYRRISVLILYSFYKNFTVSFSNILFACYSGFSGQLFYDALCGSLYNLIFTALPVMGAAVFNQTVSKRSALEHPALYKSGQRFEHFNLKLLCVYLFEGLVHSLIIFFFSIYLFADTITDPAGMDNDQWVTSTAMLSYMILVVSLKMALECMTWVWFTHLFFWLSILLWFAWSLFYSSVLSSGDMYWVSERLYSMGVYWWGLLLVCVLCVLPDLLYMYVQRMYYAHDEDIILEHELGFGASAASASGSSSLSMSMSPTAAPRSQSIAMLPRGSRHSEEEKATAQ